MQELYRSDRHRFYANVATEMNIGKTHSKDYIRLTPDKIQDKIKRFRLAYKTHCKLAVEVAEVIMLFPIYAPLLQGN